MFEGYVVDSRLVRIMSTDFRNNVIRTLGAMVNVDSEVFYTASDVASVILERNGIFIESLKSHDIRDFFGAVSSILSDAYRKGLSEVRRTNKRVHPLLYTSGKASYGYRIGYAFRKRVASPDTLREHNAVASGARSEERKPTPTALDIGEQVVSMMTYHELCQLELSIQARKEKLYSELRQKTEVTRNENEPT